MKRSAPGAGEYSGSAVSLELCRAQRAFAAAIDGRHRAGEFRGAQLRSVARRTLSALSADDRARLADWLSLQLAAAGSAGDALALLERIDMRLVAHVRRGVPMRAEALASRAGASRIVAA
ncbi:MAG TPA: hypothetical protein VH375_09910 [Rhodanobacteraceae bacterium]|jgi:hypothetical protein